MTKTFRLMGMVLVAVLMSVGFTACGDDDDEEGVGNVSNIYGTWQTSHYEGWTKVNGEVEDEWDEDVTASSSSSNYIRLEFTDDGEVNSYEWTSDRWTLEETNHYTISGSKLLFEENEGDESSVMTIKSLSESTLVLEGSYSETYDGNKFEEYQKVTLKKVG